MKKILLKIQKNNIKKDYYLLYIIYLYIFILVVYIQMRKKEN